MDPSPIVPGPFAALSFIAAPALLTNASSVLALSTINRMLRTRDAMKELLAQSERGEPGGSAASPSDAARFMDHVSRVERQATVLLRALHAIYVAVAAFATGTLVTLLGAGLAPLTGDIGIKVFAGIGVLLALVGVGGLVVGCTNLFRATQISLLNIRAEADQIRERQAKRERAAAERAATKTTAASHPQPTSATTYGE